MNDIDVSILMPGIRPENWDRVYSSIEKSTSRSFELIIVSPYPLTDGLKDKKNVKYVKDYGSPVRCSCIGASIAEGKYIDPAFADDAVYIEGAIDKNIDFLESFGEDERNVVIFKYSESEGVTDPDRFQDDDYYKLVNAYPVDRNIVPDDWLIFNSTIWHRSFFEKFGGFDCEFQATPMAHADLAVRAQRGGALAHISPHPGSICDHGQPDHQPIELAQVHFDTPIFREKYKQPLDNFPIVIDRDNWKQAPTVWFRFTQ